MSAQPTGVALPSEIHALYARIRLHCEMLVSQCCFDINTDATPGQFKIAHGVIAALDYYAQLADSGASLMACILTLRAHMTSWLAEWLSGQDTGTFFSEDTMRSWDQLHAGMPTESVSDVPSPSQDPAYLARLAGRADEGGHVVSPETAASPYSAFDTSEREIVAEAERAARRRARYPGLFEVVRNMRDPDIWADGDLDDEAPIDAWSQVSQKLDQQKTLLTLLEESAHQPNLFLLAVAVRTQVQILSEQLETMVPPRVTSFPDSPRFVRSAATPVRSTMLSRDDQMLPFYTP